MYCPVKDPYWETHNYPELQLQRNPIPLASIATSIHILYKIIEILKDLIVEGEKWRKHRKTREIKLGGNRILSSLK